MAISYPLSLPSSNFKKLEISIIPSVGIVQSPWTFQQHVYSHSGQIWTAKVVLPLMRQEEAREWAGFFTALNGRQGTFMMGDPLYDTPNGTFNTVATITATGSAGDDTVTMSNFSNSQTDVLKSGDYFQIAQRLYIVTEDVSSDGSGDAVVSIFPRLRETIASANVQFAYAQGIFRLTSNEIPIYEVNQNKVFSISFDAIEAI